MKNYDRIEIAWDKYNRACPSPIPYKDRRRVFFAGAWSLFSFMANRSETFTAADLNGLEAELRAHLQALKDGLE